MKLNGLLFTVASVALLSAGFSASLLTAAENVSAMEYSRSAKEAFRSGDYRKSAKLLEKAVKLDPANAELRDGLGKSYERQAEAASFPLFLTTKARQNFIRALELQPDNAAAMADLIEMAQQPVGLCEGNLTEASQLIDRLGAVDPDQAKREREYWNDAKQDASRRGQMTLCAPVKLSRVVVDHMLPMNKIPAATAPAPDAVIAETKPISAAATIGAGLN